MSHYRVVNLGTDSQGEPILVNLRHLLGVAPFYEDGVPWFRFRMVNKDASVYNVAKDRLSPDGQRLLREGW